MDIEKELRELDFSSFSKVKESLFTELINRRNKRMELEEDDLDLLAAAGQNLPKINKD